MGEGIKWCRETYEQSVSSRCWTFTPYDDGWGPALSADGELREIVEVERSLGEVPSWARDIAEGAVRLPPFCPHHAFPQPYLEVLDAIGSQPPCGRCKSNAGLVPGTRSPAARHGVYGVRFQPRSASPRRPGGEGPV